MTKFPAPNTISAAAQDFINTTTVDQIQSYSVETIQGIRDEIEAGFRPTVDSVRALYGPAIAESSFADVPVQIVRSSSNVINNENIILYFFGGGFVTGDPTTDQIITIPLAQMTGATVYAPHYRLAPEHPFPAAPDDGFAVYKALLETVGKDRIVIAGESAGGNLALSVMVRARDAGLPLPRAAALFSPFCDMECVGDTLATLNGVDPTLAHPAEMVTAYAAGKSLRTPELSPLYADFDSAFPPTFISSGTRDLLLSDCCRLSTRMRQAGVDVTLTVREGMWHVFEFYPELPEAQQSIDEIAAFIVEHLR